jgi:hypothetical protein
MAIAESESISGLHPMEYRLHEDNNYEADRVTAASFRRSLDYCGALWTAQQRFPRIPGRAAGGGFSAA